MNRSGFFKSVFLLSFSLLLSADPAGGDISQSTRRAFVYTTDYRSGGDLKVMSLDGSSVTESGLTLHSDAVLDSWNDYLYIIERLGVDAVIKVHPDSLDSPRQVSMGNGSNPYDIAFYSNTKAYVTRYDQPELWIINPSTLAKTGEIDLSSLADDDGLPEMAQATIIGDYLFVACQRLNRNNYFLPDNTSVIAVVDISADTLVDCDPEASGLQPIVLDLRNPQDLWVLGTTIYLGCAGSYMDPTDGGVETVNAITLESDGVLLSEKDLGGNITQVSIPSVTTGLVTVSESRSTGSVYAFDPVTGDISGKLSGPVSPAKALADGDYIYVLDRGNPAADAPAGVIIYNLGDFSRFAGPVDVGLPPADIVFLGQAAESSYAGDWRRDKVLPERLVLFPPYPNPANPETNISFSLPRSQRISLDIFSIAGWKVKTISRGFLHRGSYNLLWDGKDDVGRNVASGVYFIRLKGEGGAVKTQKVTILK